MMYLSVQLKVCEGCGSLWFRSEELGVYCGRCVERLKDFPAIGSRKRCTRQHACKRAEQAAVGGEAA
jgi:hypothetical protein